MKHNTLPALAALLLIISIGCSEVRVNPMRPDTARMLLDVPSAVRVDTAHGEAVLLYNSIFNELERIGVRVSESEKPALSIDVAFQSDDASMTLAFSNTNTSGTGQVTHQAESWYSGNTIYTTGKATAHVDVTSQTTSTTSVFQWQNSVMSIVVRRTDTGARVWAMDYIYRGGSELSSWWVHTKKQAALHCAKVVAEKIKEVLDRAQVQTQERR